MSNLYNITRQSSLWYLQTGYQVNTQQSVSSGGYVWPWSMTLWR